MVALSPRKRAADASKQATAADNVRIEQTSSTDETEIIPTVGGPADTSPSSLARASSQLRKTFSGFGSLSPRSPRSKAKAAGDASLAGSPSASDSPRSLVRESTARRMYDEGGVDILQGAPTTTIELSIARSLEGFGIGLSDFTFGEEREYNRVTKLLEGDPFASGQGVTLYDMIMAVDGKACTEQPAAPLLSGKPSVTLTLQRPELTEEELMELDAMVNRTSLAMTAQQSPVSPRKGGFGKVAGAIGAARRLSAGADAAALAREERTVTIIKPSQEARLGIRLESVSDDVPPTIAEFAPGSPGASSDLRLGELLVAVNGSKVLGHVGGSAALSGAVPGEILLLVAPPAAGGKRRPTRRITVNRLRSASRRGLSSGSPGSPRSPSSGPPTSYVERAVTLHKDDENTQLGIQLISDSTDEHPAIGLLRPRTPAVAAGIEVGEVLVAVNGAPVYGHAAGTTALKAAVGDVVLTIRSEAPATSGTAAASEPADGDERRPPPPPPEGDDDAGDPDPAMQQPPPPPPPPPGECNEEDEDDLRF